MVLGARSVQQETRRHTSHRPLGKGAKSIRFAAQDPLARKLLEAAHRYGFVVVHVEHRVQFGELKKVVHLFCEVQKF